jgi:hypothetical protein
MRLRYMSGASYRGSVRTEPLLISPIKQHGLIGVAQIIQLVAVYHASLKVGP